MKIILSDSALDEIQEIFEYYEAKANKSVAKKIKTKLLNRLKILKDNPKVGTIEDSFETHLEVRYLVQDNYKILYVVEQENIKITNFFDTRQSPNKMAI